ncbi:gluconokinase [Foetidibacter luteolus]|uniref:gluconokinase n=1 Tax=Foetidibacter luteolus TaxID=2608880 RepID=UPI00129AFB75|nr:gluconokinase [Foetidibacter luteolus]
MECIISIELGTNAVRVYAFNMEGGLIGSSKGSYPTFHPVPDFSEQDPEQIFITMLYVLKNFLSEKIYPSGYHVLSICFSASMHSLVLTDKKGAPLYNAVTWGDNRGKKEARTLKETPVGKEMYEATGTPIHPMSPLVKIAWFRNNEQEVFKQTTKFLSIKSYIIQQLSGAYIIDYSLASATGLLNIHSREWDAAALDFAGISGKQLPALVPIANADCKLRKQYQVSLGLGPDTKIIAGSSDGCFATLGAGIMNGNAATVTIEDSGAMRVIGKEILKDKGGKLFNYILDQDYYVSGGPTNNGGVIFDWFASQFGEHRAGFDPEAATADLLMQASQVLAGADGLVFLPYLLGERAPIWNANARGVFFGLNINHERKHLVRAVLEGILYEMYSIGKMLLKHRNIKNISVNGSFGTIPLVTQMLADMFNKPVSASPNVSSVSMGAYLLSATSFGKFSSLENAAKSVTLPAPVIPDKASHDTYSRHYPLFERLTVKLGDEFELLAQL